jgi:hypothetical protein
MILHKQQWLDYPSATIHYETKNISFLKMVDLYAKMGVENNTWPLVLLQPELKNIDPFSTNLSVEEMLMIRNECKNNPWYFFREVVRIPPASGNNPVQFRANRGNMAMLWCYFNSVDFVLIQPRQTGKSVSTDCLMVDLIYILAMNTEISLITKDDSLRKGNVERLKKIRRLLPKYLVPLNKADTDNQFELTCKALGNKYTTGVAQNSEFAANNLGRGSTTPTRHIDEGPFISFIGTTLPAALAAGTAAREEAELNNQPCGNIFTTTAGKKDDRDGRFMYEFVMGGAYWNEKFLDAGDKHTLKETIYRNCSGDKILINGTFNHRQLGYTDEWLYRAIAESGAKGDQANRDFFNVWTSGTQRSPLSTELNNKIRDSELDACHTTISKDLYMIKWYIEEYYLDEYLNTYPTVLSIDSSEAVGRDAIAMTLLSVTDLGVLATGSYNETNIIRYANFLVDFLVKYPKVTLVIEKKSTGQSIVDLLLVMLPEHGIDPFKRIYNRLVEESDDKEIFRKITTPLERREFNFYDSIKNKFGFNTTAESRNLLYSTILQESAKNAGFLVRDKQLIAEILGLVVKNDRIDHTNSSHDDMVIAWLIGCWFITRSKNLSFYGIDSSLILSEVRSSDKEYTFEEKWEIERQKEIKSEIQSIIEKIADEKDFVQLTIMENKLNHLTNQLKDLNDDVGSIEVLLDKIKTARETSLQINQRRNSPVTSGTTHWSQSRHYR